MARINDILEIEDGINFRISDNFDIVFKFKEGKLYFKKCSDKNWHEVGGNTKLLVDVINNPLLLKIKADYSSIELNEAQIIALKGKKVEGYNYIIRIEENKTFFVVQKALADSIIINDAIKDKSNISLSYSGFWNFIPLKTIINIGKLLKTAGVR